MAVQLQLQVLAQRIRQDIQVLSDFATKDAGGDSDLPPELREPFPRNAPDELHKARRSILDASWELQWLCADSGDFLDMHQLYYNQCSCLRWLLHFEIPKYIPLTEHGIPWDEVASLAKVPVLRLKQVARMAMTTGFPREVAPDRLAHSDKSANFVLQPGYVGWGTWATKYQGPTAYALTEATAKWGDTTAPNETAFNVAMCTDQPGFEYMSASKEMSDAFAKYMSGMALSGYMDLKHVLSGYDWSQLQEANIVDVGGSSGQVGIFLLEHYPRLRCTVQDLETTVEIASKNKAFSTLDPSVKSRLSFAAHDFFEPQPPDVAARTDAFFLRRILHDWPDERAAAIMQHLAAALVRPGARILVMDTILPAAAAAPENRTMAPLREAMLRARDLTMAQALNSRERELSDWIRLFESTNPKLSLRNYRVPEGSVLGVMEVVRAE